MVVGGPCLEVFFLPAGPNARGEPPPEAQAEPKL